MSSVDLVLRPPEIPGKYDIIPIHTSDIASFNRCRRYWDWSSPTRTNLRHRVDIYGINMNLWFGTGIHYALQSMYDPMLKRDPVETFLTWYEHQWNGGIVGEEWLELTYDAHPSLVDTGTIEETQVSSWKILGLRDILPDPVEEEFETHKQLGIGMLTYYKDYAARKDEFTAVACESTYSIPLGFESTDLREESPNYRKKIEVHARGKRDSIIWYPERDVFRVLENKTAARIDEDYFLKYEKDPQAMNYLWSALMEAKYYDLPWQGRDFDAVVVNALRKNYPKPPTVLKNGISLSVDRQNEGTNAELFMEAINEFDARREWFEDDDKAQRYYDYLVQRGDDLFIQRDVVPYNEHEMYNTGEHLKMIAQEMLNPEINIYPNPSGSSMCTRCVFRQPCLSKDDGSDWQGMLADGYEQNRGR